jgi:mono/diheme cytochrome c family protein
MFRAFLILGFVVVVLPTSHADPTDAQRGYRLLRSKAYLPPDFDQPTLDQLWTVWEQPLRERARSADAATRRQMAYERYGLIADDKSDFGGTLQYVVDESGNWVMNCLSCHQGQVDGRTIPGVPNSQFALASLTEDVRAVKLKQDKPLARMEIGSLFIPLGNSRGTTNAVMFGVVLMHFRDAELNLVDDRALPPTVHHDLDAPAWWHFHKKQRLYYDGFVPKSHRALMQFLLVPANGPEQFREWEEDYQAIDAYIRSLQPPAYPYDTDATLAAEGQRVFNRRCVSCHGRYDGAEQSYPNKVVPIDVVGTDRVRLDALNAEHRRRYAASWFNDYGQQQVDAQPPGFVAPPLDGIWATAPYLHNGSVPTLWHLLHADQRPVVWRRRNGGFDRAKVGLNITTYNERPASANS